MQSLFGGYVAPSDAVDYVGATADVSEMLPVSLDASGSSVSFPIAHFSGYILATGKSDTTTKAPSKTTTSSTTTSTKR